MTSKCPKFCCLALGVSIGIVTGLFMMLFAWAGLFWGYGLDLIEEWSNVFPGYTYSLVGGVIGFGWGFLEGFITGFVIAWIYNLCVSRCKSCYLSDSEEQ